MGQLSLLSRIEKLEPPLTYQGGKHRLSGRIADYIGLPDKFYDLCCGSGAVTIELVNRGMPATAAMMCDAGPWGVFWEKIGAGDFSTETFRWYLRQVPSDREMIKGFMEELATVPAHIDTPYVFLLLQAASFGGKAIWIQGDRWRNCSFRSYWMPTKKSNRRSPVNPMMPMPEALYRRVNKVAEWMQGVYGLCADVKSVSIDGGVAYVDPPYSGTTEYGHSLNLEDLVSKIGCNLFVSEGFPLKGFDTVCLSSGREKGGISGSRKTANEEWLSWRLVGK